MICFDCVVVLVCLWAGCYCFGLTVGVVWIVAFCIGSDCWLLVLIVACCLLVLLCVGVGAM